MFVVHGTAGTLQNKQTRDDCEEFAFWKTPPDRGKLKFKQKEKCSFKYTAETCNFFNFFFFLTI